VAKDNEASCGLMTKLGFIINEEKSFKKYHMDISYDSYVFEYSI
jgi:ribosomal-protein-alanine N-acetyltransferase